MPFNAKSLQGPTIAPSITVHTTVCIPAATKVSREQGALVGIPRASIGLLRPSIVFIQDVGALCNPLLDLTLYIDIGETSTREAGWLCSSSHRRHGSL